ncbi:PQQ-binding-like beta-propeller repeat protein [Sulfurisphaera ohwakuensis]|uniref:outer membrane protein assembly factor BamB family protein n=1 Tax=Sulfurisphaera ohwakuensis TaxID=69656 RepID=UPI0036F363C2
MGNLKNDVSEVTPTSVEIVKYSVYLDGINFVDCYYPSNNNGLNSSVFNTNFLMFGYTYNREPIIKGNLNVTWFLPLPFNYEPNLTLWTHNVNSLGKGWAAAYRQTVGCAVGPSEANGIVYVASNSGPIYGINVYTGKIIFKLLLPGTLSMWMPLVYHGILYLGLGGAMFDYQQGLLNAYGGGHRGQYTGVSGLLAVNATTGKPLWFILTKSQAMPTGIIVNNTLVFDDGDGNIYGVNPFNGKILWKFSYDGSGNMASLDYYNGIVIAGFSEAYPVNTSAIVGVYIKNGSLAWIIKLPFAVTSSVGDAVPSVYNDYLVDGFLGYGSGHGPYLSDINAREVLLIANASTGKILVLENVTNKTVHPSDTNNGYNPLVINGTIYLPTIAGTIEAFNLQGKLLWSSPQISNTVIQSAPLLYKNYLIVTTGPNIVVLNASNGKVINIYHTPFIIRQQPIIVGQTLIETTSTNWVFAIPLTNIIYQTEVPPLNITNSTQICFLSTNITTHSTSASNNYIILYVAVVIIILLVIGSIMAFRGKK